MRVKELQTEDQVLQVVQLGRDMFDLFEHAEDYDELSVAMEGVSLTNDFTRNNRNCWIAYTDSGEPVGFLYGIIHAQMFSKRSVAMPTYLYVNKAFRATRAAVMLVQEFEHWAFSHDVKTLHAGAVGDSKKLAARANKFYNKLGYVTVGEVQVKQI